MPILLLDQFAQIRKPDNRTFYEIEARRRMGRGIVIFCLGALALLGIVLFAVVPL